MLPGHSPLEHRLVESETVCCYDRSSQPMAAAQDLHRLRTGAGDDQYGCPARHEGWTSR